MKSALVPVIVATLVALGGCRSKEKFPAIGDQMASPIDVAVADDGAHFFVLNADFDRTYDKGSVVVLDREGAKVKAVEIPRMGRNIVAAGNDLLVTVDYGDNEKKKPQVLLFDATNPADPKLTKEFDIDCSPINAVMAKGYEYFAVACTNGALYIGTLAGDRTQSTLKQVRYWGISRRALYLDPQRGLLLGFTTDLSKQAIPDEELLDVTSFSDLAVEQPEKGANEIPDDMEKSRRAQSNKSQRQTFQFFVYDLNAEKASAPGCKLSDTENCVFPYRDAADPVAQAELRFIYFKLANFDGTPDQSEHYYDADFKFYRTNFYEAKGDPDDSSVFYLSQRGAPNTSKFANQIIKVSITGDLRDKAQKTSDVLGFERVYGFKGAESNKYVYPGDFEVARVGGQKMILVNNFRDLVNWVRGDTYFSLGAQTLDDTPWFTEMIGGLSPKSDIRTYYQVAMLPDGRGVSCSFYGNRVVMFDLVPGVGFSNVKPVE